MRKTSKTKTFIYLSDGFIFANIHITAMKQTARVYNDFW